MPASAAVADVAGYLEDLRASRLGTLDADAPDAGEISISETLRLSEAQLPEAERDAWRKLGVFTASFDARAAKAVVGAEEAMLTHFVRRSLLEREGADRYKLHDLAADYACAQLHASAVVDLHLAHARHYTAVGDEAYDLYLTKGKTTDGLALFDRERAQIEAAYAWLAARDDEAAARQIIALVNAVVYTGQGLRFHPRQRIAWLQGQLCAARRVQDRGTEGAALGNLGVAHDALGDARKAIEFYEQRWSSPRDRRPARGGQRARQPRHSPTPPWATRARPLSSTSKRWPLTARSATGAGKATLWATSALPTPPWATRARPLSSTSRSWSLPARSATGAGKATRYLIQRSRTTSWGIAPRPSPARRWRWRFTRPSNTRRRQSSCYIGKMVGAGVAALSVFPD